MKDKSKLINTFRKRLPLLLVSIACLCVGIAAIQLMNPAKAEAAALQQTLPSGRTYNIYKPSTVAGPAPIVIVMHGLALTPSWAEQTTGFDALATKDKFLVVYARGTNGSWNAGSCCNNNKSDDIGYLDQIVADVNSRIYPVNTKREYLVGFSNGGMMAYRAACAEPSRWAAIGVMSGTSEAPCAPRTPFSVIHIHGLKDTTVPYNGGYSAYLKMNLTSAAMMQPYLNGYFGCKGMDSGTLYGATVRTSTGCPAGYCAGDDYTG